MFRYYYYDFNSDCYVLNDTGHNFTGEIAEEENNEQSVFLNAESKNIVKMKECSVFAVVDLAATTKQTSDYTAVVVYALTPNKQILILDVIREKFEGSQHLELLKKIHND